MHKTILLALLLACGAAQAADWVQVNKSIDGKYKYFVDKSSIRIEAGKKRAWLKTVPTPRTDRGPGPGIYAKKWVSYSLALYFFDCANETTSMASFVIYFDDGTNLGAPADGLWESTAPDSAMVDVQEFICAWRPK